MNKDRNIGIAAYAETKIVMASGRSSYDMAAEVLESILEKTGFEPGEIDGLAVAETMSDTANPFWAAYMADMLGLSPTWLELLGLGGVSAVGGVARAVAAIEAGFCTTVLVLSTDAQSSKNQSEQGGPRPRWSVWSVDSTLSPLARPGRPGTRKTGGDPAGTWTPQS